MTLQWLEPYRSIIELIIKFGNEYSRHIKIPGSFGTDYLFSLSEIQVIEYVLENDERHQTISELAIRLGITQGAFSKIANKMLKKGFLEKYHTSDNKKNVIVCVSKLGKKIYREYSAFVNKNVFSKVFAVLDEIPKENIEKFEEVIRIISKLPPSLKKQEIKAKLLPVNAN